MCPVAADILVGLVKASAPCRKPIMAMPSINPAALLLGPSATSINLLPRGEAPIDGQGYACHE